MTATVFDLISKPTEKPTSQSNEVSNEKTIFDFIGKTKEPEQLVKQDQELGKIIEGQKETGTQYGLRTAARTAARAAEVPLEMAGAALGSVEKMGKLASSFISPEAEKGVTEVFEKGKESGLMGLGAALTPENIKSFEKKQTGEYLQPRTEGEKTYDEVVQDLTSYMIPIPGSGTETALYRLGRGALISGAGQTAKQTAKFLGTEADTQDKVKHGTMFLTSLINPNGAKNYYNRLYDQSEKALPAWASGNASGLRKDLNNVIAKAKTGGSTAASDIAINESKQILDKIQNGRLPYETAVAHQRTINLNSSNLYNKNLSSPEIKAIKNEYDTIRNHLKKYISQSKKQYPEFYNLHRSADEAYGTMAQSLKFSNMLKRNWGKVTSLGLGSLATSVFGGGLPGGVIATGSALGAGSVLKGLELSYRFAKSPILRHYYIQAAQAATQENLGKFLHNASKLKENAVKDPELAELLQ